MKAFSKMHYFFLGHPVYFYTMKERSEKKKEASLMKDNRLRIPNITRNLYISLSVLEIIAIEVRAFGKVDFSRTSNWGNVY